MVKGYKVFNPDWTCRGFQYVVGATYSYDEEPELCKFGFHFCQKVEDCFNYYSFNPRNKIAEVEALGVVKTEEDKSVTNRIKIVRELSWYEMLETSNAGFGNTGLNNSGHLNTGRNNYGSLNTGEGNLGSINSGSRNSGNYNTGDYNSGDYNTGWFNTGLYNTGNNNAGRYNTGMYNSGYFNCGNFNSGNYSTGYFNSKETPFYVFNKPCNMSREDFEDLPGYKVLKSFKLTEWVLETEKEKGYIIYKTTGGYLMEYSYESAWEKLWNNLTPREKEAVQQLPNFDPDIFYEITGIGV